MRKKILFVAAESGPFIKTGGLGSVLESLPVQLDPERYDVRVAIPGYACIPDVYKRQMEEVLTFCMNLNWRRDIVTVKKLSYKGICFYFIGNADYFSGDAPYGDMSADVEKFTFFDKAVLELLAYLEFEPDIIHCHDWQAAMVPVFLKEMYQADPFYARIRTILTIHNLKFQGWADIGRMKDITGLPDRVFSFDILESFGQANMLKGGISCADEITTVSKTYAQEIRTPEYGEGLDQALLYRSDHLCGIVNGIDYEIYDPVRDPFLEKNYGTKGQEKAHPINKKALQDRAGLPEKEDAFAMGIVARLTDQKGFDLFRDMMEELLKENVQLYILGSGQEEYERLFGEAVERHPQKVWLDTVYTDEKAKSIYGGCDAILMPSRFEPCGLSQMMSLRYGAVPIVRRTGGLADTVAVYGAGEKHPTGFGFDSYEPEAFLKAIRTAKEIYDTDRDTWQSIIRRGMRKDYSWHHSARIYEKMYDALLK